MTPLAVADLDRMATDDRWLGFGYIGGRARALEDGWDVTRGDTLALEMANAAGLDYEAFFEWANSKHGRWFADCMIGGGDVTMARRYGPA